MLNRLALRVVLVFSLAFAGTTNAALISQDITSDSWGMIGSITVNSDDADSWGVVTDWVSFDFLGYDVDQPAFLFEAEIDLMDIYAGILSLNYDVNDSYDPAWAYSGYIEADFGGDLMVFDVDTGDFLLYLDDLSFGEVLIPEPSALLLFFTGLIGLVTRRKMV